PPLLLPSPEFPRVGSSPSAVRTLHAARESVRPSSIAKAAMAARRPHPDGRPEIPRNASPAPARDHVQVPTVLYLRTRQRSPRGSNSPGSPANPSPKLPEAETAAREPKSPRRSLFQKSARRQFCPARRRQTSATQTESTSEFRATGPT